MAASNPVAFDGKVFVACVADAGYSGRSRARVGDIDVWSIDPKTGKKQFINSGGDSNWVVVVRGVEPGEPHRARRVAQQRLDPALANGPVDRLRLRRPRRHRGQAPERRRARPLPRTARRAARSDRGLHAGRGADLDAITDVRAYDVRDITASEAKIEDLTKQRWVPVLVHGDDVMFRSSILTQDQTLRILSDLTGLWERHSDTGRTGLLDDHAAAYPELARTWRAAALVAGLACGPPGGEMAAMTRTGASVRGVTR